MSTTQIALGRVPLTGGPQIRSRVVNVLRLSAYTLAALDTLDLHLASLLLRPALTTREKDPYLRYLQSAFSTTLPGRSCGGER